MNDDPRRVQCTECFGVRVAMGQRRQRVRWCSVAAVRRWEDCAVSLMFEGAFDWQHHHHVHYSVKLVAIHLSGKNCKDDQRALRL